MGKIVSKVTDAVGLTNTKAETRAANLAADNAAYSRQLSEEQIKLMREQLEFQKSQYDDWKDIYGDIQENLGEYYNSLNPDDFATLGLENQQREYQAAVTQINKEAAKRGISDSGLDFAATTAATFQNAEAKARIRTNAEKEVAEQKLGFLGVGLGQGTQMLGQINNAASNANNAYGIGVNAATQFGNAYLNRSTKYGIANLEAMGDLVGTATGYIAG